MTGARGYLGRAFVRAGYHELSCDVTSVNYVEREITCTKPDMVLHLAGKSNPAYCQQHEEVSSRINVGGTRNVVDVCEKYKIPFILLSSSQIWGGGWRDAFNKHAEDSSFTTAVNNYGVQKLVAEMATVTANIGWDGAKVIRTSYVFDRTRFAQELSSLAHGNHIDAPAFLKRSFIYLSDFVELVQDYCTRFDDMPSVLHLAGSKTASYCEFWIEVCEQLGFYPYLVNCRNVEKDGYAARRPHNGGLDVSLSKKLGFRQTDYIEGIRRMKNEG